MVPDFRRDDVWTPVFTGMTDKDGAFFKKLKCYDYWNLFVIWCLGFGIYPNSELLTLHSKLIFVAQRSLFLLGRRLLPLQ